MIKEKLYIILEGTQNMEPSLQVLTDDKRCDVKDDYWKKEVWRRFNEYELLDYEYEM